MLNAVEFLKNALKSNLEKSGVPKGLQKEISGGFTIVAGSKVLDGLAGDALREIVAVDEKIFSTN